MEINEEGLIEYVIQVTTLNNHKFDLTVSLPLDVRKLQKGKVDSEVLDVYGHFNRIVREKILQSLRWTWDYSGEGDQKPTKKLGPRETACPKCSVGILKLKPNVLPDGVPYAACDSCNHHFDLIHPSNYALRKILIHGS